MLRFADLYRTAYDFGTLTFVERSSKCKTLPAIDHSLFYDSPVQSAVSPFRRDRRLKLSSALVAFADFDQMRVGAGEGPPPTRLSGRLALEPPGCPRRVDQDPPVLVARPAPPRLAALVAVERLLGTPRRIRRSASRTAAAPSPPTASAAYAATSNTRPAPLSPRPDRRATLRPSWPPLHYSPVQHWRAAVIRLPCPPHAPPMTAAATGHSPDRQ